MYTHMELELSAKGIDFTVLVEGDVVSGGSNSYGSDEPEWCEVEDMTLTHTDGRKLRKDTSDLIYKLHSDYITDMLVESVD